MARKDDEKPADEEVGGGPGEGDPYKAAEAATVEIPAALTDALTSLASGMQSLTQKVDALEHQAPVQAPTTASVTKVDPAASDDPYGAVDFDGLFEDPSATMRGFGKVIVGEMAKELDRRDQISATANTERNFWSTFYEGHPEFKRGQDHALIVSIANIHSGDLKTLTPEQFSDKLGDWTKEEILRISKRARSSSRQVAETANAAAGGPEDNVQRGAEEPGDDDKVTSMSSMLRQRRAARRTASR